MKLPDPIAETFQQVRGRPPLASARAMYDLTGGLGETFVAADEEGLELISRPINGEGEQHTFAWSDITDAAVHTESVFAQLELHAPTGIVHLQFSAWDEASLRQMLQLWQAHHPSPQAAPPTPPPTTASVDAAVTAAKPPAQALRSVTPLIAFCASIHAMIECDEVIEQTELNFLAQRVPDPTAIQAGHRFLEEHGRDTLCACLNAVLSSAQKNCLMANLVAVAMVDGMLQSEEQELLERFQTALHIADAKREQIFGVLMAKNNLSVFAAGATETTLTAADGLTPLLAYCAALHAMMEVDHDRLPEEEQLLTLAVPYPEDIRLGRDFLQAYGVDHLLSRLNQVLNHPQKLCLLANLIAVVMLDGVIHRTEQALLRRFQQAMELSDETYARLYETLLLKDNLAIFAEPAPDAGA